MRVAEHSYDACGEMLRQVTFVGGKDDVGCYSTFDVAPGFKPVKAGEALFEAMWQRIPSGDDYEEISRITAHYNPLLGLLVAWHWDGDGHLYFDSLPLGFAIENTDCKKGYGWDSANRVLPRLLKRLKPASSSAEQTPAKPPGCPQTHHKDNPNDR